MGLEDVAFSEARWKGVSMAVSRRRFSPEFKTEAVREVVDKSKSIADVSRSLGISEQTLGNWVRAYRNSHDANGVPMSFEERTRVKELERENRELKEQLDFLEKAAAFFAQRRR
jgi:transposase